MKEEFKLNGTEIVWPIESSITKFIVGVPSNVVFPALKTYQVKQTSKFEGSSIDVFNRAVENLHCHFDYQFQISDESKENPDYSDLVDLVANKTFDAVVSDITILSSRNAKVDLTQPYTDTGLRHLFFLLFSYLAIGVGQEDAFTGEPTKQMEMFLCLLRNDKVLLLDIGHQSSKPPQVLERKLNRSEQEDKEHFGLSDLAFSSGDKFRAIWTGSWMHN
ncbi:hypothetical protein SUGI_0751860 [Cryptomeria japonica]|nr:hypothetical protein SUGI_0751860 [Cryptomeria japonica]